MLPDWPQPGGIFSGGSHFHPLVFLTTLRLLYDKINVEGFDATQFDLETLAFAKMVHSRSVIRQNDGAILFRLFSFLTLSPNVPELIVEHDGKKYLALHCMIDSGLVADSDVPRAVSTTSGDGCENVVLKPVGAL